MDTDIPSPHALRVADLAKDREHPIGIIPSKAELDVLKDALDLLKLQKVRFSGTLRPVGKENWELVAKLGATVEQPCVATLEPVRTRIETSIRRHYAKDVAEITEIESEMPDDDDCEPLQTQIDPFAVLYEALALALPDFPRAPETDEVDLSVASPGVIPLTDADMRPFAGLRDLRDALIADDDGEEQK